LGTLPIRYGVKRVSHSAIKRPEFNFYFNIPEIDIFHAYSTKKISQTRSVVPIPNVIPNQVVLVASPRPLSLKMRLNAIFPLKTLLYYDHGILEFGFLFETLHVDWQSDCNPLNFQDGSTPSPDATQPTPSVLL
jgi:hypothetical protein